MAAQSGKDFILEIKDISGQFVSVAGLKVTKFVLISDTIKTTHAASDGRWQTLLNNDGTRRASLSGKILFKDARSDQLIKQYFFDGIIASWQIIIPALGKILGEFQIATLEYHAEFNSELLLDLTLESAGSLEFSSQI